MHTIQLQLIQGSTSLAENMFNLVAVTTSVGCDATDMFFVYYVLLSYTSSIWAIKIRSPEYRSDHNDSLRVFSTHIVFNNNEVGQGFFLQTGKFQFEDSAVQSVRLN